MTNAALEHAIYEYLTADTRVMTAVNTRVYLQRLPEGTTLPAVAYHRVSTERLYTFDSFDDTDPFVRARVQFDCWGRTALEAVEVGEAVMVALSGYDGSLSGEPIQASFVVDEFDDYEASTKFYRKVADMMITYEDDLGGVDAFAMPESVGGEGGA